MAKSEERALTGPPASSTPTGMAFTQKEIREAQEAADGIYRDLKMLGRMTFTVVEGMYNFSNEGFYKRIGFDTIDDWLVSIGYAPSTYRKYMSIYKALTIRLGIPRTRYEDIDVGKVTSLQRLAEEINAIGMPDEEQIKLLGSHIEEASELPIQDLVTSTDEKVRDLRMQYSGEEPDEPESSSGDGGVVSDPREKIKPEIYILAEPISKADRESDPRINSKNLVEIKRVPTKFWYDPKTDRIILELR